MQYLSLSGRGIRRDAHCLPFWWLIHLIPRCCFPLQVFPNSEGSAADQGNNSLSPSLPFQVIHFFKNTPILYSLFSLSPSPPLSLESGKSLLLARLVVKIRSYEAYILSPLLDPITFSSGSSRNWPY